MYIQQDRLELVYATDQTTSKESLRTQLGIETDCVALSLAKTVEAVRDAAGRADCLLVEGTKQWLDPVLPVLQTSAVPAVVFLEDNEFPVERVLRAESTEIVRSSTRAAPTALIRRRIESVVDAESGRTLEAGLLERYETILHTAPDAIYQLDSDGIIVDVNDTTVELTGYDRSELVDEHVSQLLTPESVEIGERAIETLLADKPENGGSGVLPAEIKVETSSGEQIPCEVHLSVLERDGELTGTVGVVRDISEKQKRKQELERIYDTSPTGIGVINEHGLLTRVNERTAEIFGVDREQLLDRPFEEIPFDMRDGTGEQIAPSEMPMGEVLESGEALYGYEAIVVRPDGEEVWISWNGDPIVNEDGEVEQIVATIEEITERKERERKISTQRDELAQLDRINRIIRDVDQALIDASTREAIEQAVCDRLAKLDRYEFALTIERVGGDRLEARHWTDGWAEYTDSVFPLEGLTPETSAGSCAIETGEIQTIPSIESEDEPWQRHAISYGIRSIVSIPVVYEEHTYGVIALYAGEADGFSERELAVLEELGATVGYAIAAAQSREREQTLTALYEATQDLLAATDRQEICEVVVETAGEVLDLVGIGVYLFDDDENILWPAAATDEFLEFYGETTVFGPDREDSETWHTYVTGESQFFEDIRTANRATAETDARGVLMLPLGKHGVFVAASTEMDAFDEAKRRLVGLLAATTEAALDRVVGQVGIQERDQQLAERGRQLGRLERLLAVCYEIAQLLHEARTREEIVDRVPERLLGVEEFAFAWIGRVESEKGILQPQSWAGTEDDYLDDVSLSVGGSEPSAVAVCNGTHSVTADTTDVLREQNWAREAVARGFQSTLAVPLVYRGATYGVLTVYAEEPEAFDDATASLLAQLGETVASTISTAETRRGILAEVRTQIEVLIPEKRFLNEVATVAGQSVVCREIRPKSDGKTRVLFELSDPPVADIQALQAEFVAVDSLEHVERGETDRFRARLSGETVMAGVLGAGGVPQEVVANPSDTRVTIQLPQELDVRVFLTRLQQRFPDTELRSRRTVERRDCTPGAPREQLRELTDRQREVLVRAYESGFFQSPRETTGEELASLLDISQPTLTHHLREAQRRLFSELFHEDDLDN
jgi:PAS domain S-box-containing protein